MGATPLKFEDPTTSISVNFSNLPVHCSGTDQDIANLKTDY